jgi:hypothetical protein
MPKVRFFAAQNLLLRWKASMNRSFVLHGSIFTSHFPFTMPLVTAGSGIFRSSTFRCRLVSAVSVLFDNIAPVFINSGLTTLGAVNYFLFVLSEKHYVFRISGLADFHITPMEISCYQLEPTEQNSIELHFLSNIISLWLEQQGHLVIHASGVEVEGHSIAFLGESGQGKSSLVTSFVQAAYPLITDDTFSIHRQHGDFYTYPAYPCLRMWPDQADHFLTNTEELELVHPLINKKRVPVGGEQGFGQFCQGKRPIQRLYLLERGDPSSTVAIHSVSSAKALVELIRHSYVRRTVQAAGLQPHRIDLFIDFLKQVSVRRLIYPTGYQHLPRVRDAILEDLAQL